MSESPAIEIPKKKRGCLARLARLLGLVLFGAIIIWFALPFSARSALLPSNARDILEHAEHFEIIAVDPYRTHAGNNRFHNYLILGRAELPDANARKQLLSSLYGSLGHGIPGIMCFNPRHGIHATRDGHSVDLLICFECQQVEGFIDGKRTDALVGAGANSRFNTIFKNAGLTVAD